MNQKKNSIKSALVKAIVIVLLTAGGTILVYSLISLLIASIMAMEPDKSLVEERHIICWSGGEVIYDAYTVGPVRDWGGHSFYWTEDISKRQVWSNADCIILE